MKLSQASPEALRQHRAWKALPIPRSDPKAPPSPAPTPPEARCIASWESYVEKKPPISFHFHVPKVTVGMIKGVVSRVFDVTEADIDGPWRARSASRARQCVMFLARELTNCSLPEIGRRIGGKDHTTVLHAVREWPRFMQEEEDLATMTAECRAHINYIVTRVNEENDG